jgi:hypothetical protein
MLAMATAGGDGTRIGIHEPRIIERARGTEIGEQVVGAEQDHVDALDRHDRVDLRDGTRGLRLHDHHRGIVHRGHRARGIGRAKPQLRQRPGRRAPAERRVLGRSDGRACLLGRIDMRNDDAHGATIENARDPLAAMRGHAHQWRETGLLGGDA